MFWQQQHFDCGSVFAGLLFLIIVGKVFGLICWEQKSSEVSPIYGAFLVTFTLFFNFLFVLFHIKPLAHV